MGTAAVVVVVAIGAIALVFGYLTRPGKDSPQEVKEVAKVLQTGRCSCGAPVAKDLMDNGAVAVINCLNSGCGNRWQIDIGDED